MKLKMAPPDSINLERINLRRYADEDAGLFFVYIDKNRTRLRGSFRETVVALTDAKSSRLFLKESHKKWKKE